jgi:hypothetical protein
VKGPIDVALANFASFTAAQLGQTTLISDEHVHCEYPVDADDEYVTEKEFLRTLPGESTKLSAALALFKIARVLSKTLKAVYQTGSSYDVSVQTIESLRGEMEQWSDDLAPHLRLYFEKDKPSTGVVSSRSPLLVSEVFILLYKPMH